MAEPIVEEKVRAFVEAVALRQRGQPIDGRAWRLDSGLIDSVGIYEVVALLEESFGVTISDAEVVPANFASVERIAAFVRDKQQRR